MGSISRRCSSCGPCRRRIGLRGTPRGPGSQHRICDCTLSGCLCVGTEETSVGGGQGWCGLGCTSLLSSCASRSRGGSGGLRGVLVPRIGILLLTLRTVMLARVILGICLCLPRCLRGVRVRVVSLGSFILVPRAIRCSVVVRVSRVRLGRRGGRCRGRRSWRRGSRSGRVRRDGGCGRLDVEGRVVA